MCNALEELFCYLIGRLCFQVGVLVSLALMLRAAPATALLLSDSLLRGGSHFSGPTRLPFLLWTLNQAARSAFHRLCMLAFWYKVSLHAVLVPC